MPYSPSRLRALLALRTFVPYVPSCLTRLRVLRAFVPYALSRLTCLTHAPFSSALHPSFVRLKIFLG